MGSAIITACVFAVAMALMLAVKATRTLRISPEGEIEGIDIHEHGAPAYHPEAAYTGIGEDPPSLGTLAPAAARSSVLTEPV
jgi:Amt family ammonium transporter